jgi:hypothetical protein
MNANSGTAAAGMAEAVGELASRTADLMTMVVRVFVAAPACEGPVQGKRQPHLASR